MGHRFNANSRARTRCYFVNNKTNKKLKVQFNPTSIPYERTANFTSIESPGMSYPLTQYTGGNVREFTIDLFYYDKPYSGKINTARKFFEALMPPEKNKSSFKKPPTFTIAYGYFTKTLVLQGLRVNDEELDPSGRPIQTRFTLTVRQIGR